MVMTSSSRLNLSAALFRLLICWSWRSITLDISFTSRLRSVTAFSRFGPRERGVRGMAGQLGTDGTDGTDGTGIVRPISA